MIKRLMDFLFKKKHSTHRAATLVRQDGSRHRFEDKHRSLISKIMEKKPK